MPDPTYQVHDFEPGIADSGLFWTIPISPGSIKADPASGRARFRVEALKIGDYHDFFNAVGGGTPVPSRVSFEVVWEGGGSPVDLRDETFTFEGHYVPGPARPGSASSPRTTAPASRTPLWPPVNTTRRSSRVARAIPRWGRSRTGGTSSEVGLFERRRNLTRPGYVALHW